MAPPSHGHDVTSRWRGPPIVAEAVYASQRRELRSTSMCLRMSLHTSPTIRARPVSWVLVPAASCERAGVRARNSRTCS